jgi:hypothetical protein
MQDNLECRIDLDNRVICPPAGNPATTTTDKPVTAMVAASAARQPAQVQLVAERAAGPKKATFDAPEKLRECCIHVKAEDLSKVSAETPVVGRFDCPTIHEMHEAEVKVIEVRPDGQGGMVALYRGPWHDAGHEGPTAPRIMPVCTVAPQETEPVPCCIIERDGRQYVFCEDENHELHGRPAEIAVKLGHTLQLCPAPPDVPSCCVELGQWTEGGKTYNGRLICDDVDHAAHMRLVNVTGQPGQGYAQLAIPYMGREYQLRLPICKVDIVPEAVPCCIRNGKLWCPEREDIHGQDAERFKKMHPGVIIEACPEKPPEEPPPPDCCVQKTDDGRYVLVCTDLNSPWHGYELSPSDCQEGPDGTVCGVILEIDGERRKGVFPLCPPPPPERVPADCCFDPATGTIVCPEDPDSQYHGVKVSLLEMKPGGPDGVGVAVLQHSELNDGRPFRLPLCYTGSPRECCFKPAATAQEGAVGTLVCPGNPQWHGLQAVLVELNQLPNGQLIGHVSWAGGAARMLLCAPPVTLVPEIPPTGKRPPEKVPEIPRPYYCCVNTETGLFVCPADAERNGQPAGPFTDIGNGVLKLQDGTLVPACGPSCPAPPACPPCPKHPGFPGYPAPCDPRPKLCDPPPTSGRRPPEPPGHRAPCDDSPSSCWRGKPQIECVVRQP